MNRSQFSVLSQPRVEYQAVAGREDSEVGCQGCVGCISEGSGMAKECPKKEMPARADLALL